MLVVRFVDNFLEECDLLKYQEYVEKVGTRQSIIKDEKMTREFWQKYGKKVGGCVGKEILPYVTVTNSKKPLGRHKDSKMGGEKYKVLIYLNEIKNGGTIFYNNNEGGGKELIENKVNRMVLFDMNIEHESEKFSNNDVIIIRKKAIGFRILE